MSQITKKEYRSEIMNKTKNYIAENLINKTNEEKNLMEEIKTQKPNEENDIEFEIKNLKPKVTNHNQIIQQKRQEADQIKDAKSKFENFTENYIQKVKNYTQTLGQERHNLKINKAKLIEKIHDAELQDESKIKKAEPEVIEKLKEIFDEIVEFTKITKRLINEEENFKVDVARKFRDTIKNIEAKKYKGSRLDDRVKPAEEIIGIKAKKTQIDIIPKKAKESNEPEDTIKPHEETKLIDSSKIIKEEPKEKCNKKNLRRQWYRTNILTFRIEI